MHALLFVLDHTISVLSLLICFVLYNIQGLGDLALFLKEFIVFFNFPENLIHMNFPFPQADRPIASIAFHAQGELLAVASGHKVRKS